MTYNPNILPSVLRARSLTSDQLSQRLKLDPSEMQRELEREPEPGQGILNRIAKELAVPPFTFFRETVPALHDVIPDFRSTSTGPSAKTSETVRSIQFGEGIQRALESDKNGVSDLPNFDVSSLASIDESALRARQHFNITIEDQINARDARAFYLVCRKKIEDWGIVVLHDSFPAEDGSGFCLYDSRHPVIVVNTLEQTKGRRLFTLIHELAHVLMGKTGISDPFIRNNSIERACNRFAGSFLIPQTYLSSLLRSPVSSTPSTDDVKWASRRLKISQEATALRLEQLGVYTSGSYAKWKAIVRNANPDYWESKGGPADGPPPQEKVKLAKYGFQFARAFDRLLRQELITEVNLYRATGLKPKYQRQYFEYVKALTTAELGSLELGDD